MPFIFLSGIGKPSYKGAAYSNLFITPIVISNITSTVAGQIVVTWSGGLGNNVKYSYALSVPAGTATISTANTTSSSGTNTTTLTLSSTTSITTTVTITGTVLDGSGSETSGQIQTLSPLADVTGFSISLDLSSSTVPTTTTNGTSVTKLGAPTMYNDATRGYVLTVTGSTALAIPITLQPNYTVTCWIRVPGSVSSGGSVWQFTNNGGLESSSALYLKVNQGGTYIGSNGSASWNTQSNSFTVGTTWNFFAVVSTGSTFNLYMNGNIISNQTTTGKTAFSSPVSINVFIGYDSGTEYVSNFRVYPSALSSTQITNLYNYQLK